MSAPQKPARLLTDQPVLAWPPPDMRKVRRANRRPTQQEAMAELGEHIAESDRAIGTGALDLPAR